MEGVFLGQTGWGEENCTEGHSRKGQKEARRVACKGGRGTLVWQDDGIKVIRVLNWQSLLLCPYLLYCNHCFIPNFISVLPGPFAYSEYCVPSLYQLFLYHPRSSITWIESWLLHWPGTNYLTSLYLSSSIFKEEIIMG